MKYIWDENKNRSNIDKHGIDFIDAVRIFEGGTLEQEDRRFDYGEIRIYAIGLINGLEIVVVYTDTETDQRRIISARRAEPHERKAYWQSRAQH
ncbi:MAG: BrnT family toxin [Methylococcaceae bacterium]|nr:BrnT family toxin [Methylococcaceae bacterium]